MEQKNNDEIDLGYLINKMSDGFRSLVKLIFNAISFFLKYKYIIAILFIAGAVLGYFADKYGEEVYKNELIVIPNFESTDYLYGKVDALQSKIKSTDTVFLKALVGANYGLLKGIEIEPITDIFTYVSKTREKVDLFKILVDKQDIPDYIEDPQNNKYNKYHRISINIKGTADSENIVQAIVSYFNDNPHYLAYQKAGIENTKFQISSYSLMLSQLDSIINTAGDLEKSNRTNQSVFINDNSQLNFLFQSKERFLDKLLELKLQQEDEEQVIKVAAVSHNIKDTDGIHVSKKILYPFLLVMLFSGFFFVKFLLVRMRDFAFKNEK